MTASAKALRVLLAAGADTGAGSRLLAHRALKSRMRVNGSYVIRSAESRPVSDRGLIARVGK